MASTELAGAVDLIENPPRGFIYAAFCCVIAIQYLYLFTFNWVPALRLPLSGSLAGIHIVLAMLTVLVRPAPWNLALTLSAIVTIATFIPAHALGYGEVSGFDGAEAVRKLILPVMMIWILSYPLALPRRMLWWCAIVGTLLGAAIAFTGPPVYLGGGFDDPRLASITGELDQMHPSAKFIALQLLLLDLLRRGGLMSTRLSWAMIALCAVVLFGFGSRSQMVFITMYYLSLTYFKWTRISFIKWSPPLIFLLLLTASIIALKLGTDVQSWGSGRIGTWYYRIYLVADRDLVELFFGGGIGSDKVWTPEWSFNSEGLIAHNDYLYFLMEHGIVGLIIPFAILSAIWLQTREYGRAIVLAIAVSSFFDNGYFRSPLLAALLAIVLATSILVSLIREEADLFAASNSPARNPPHDGRR